MNQREIMMKIQWPAMVKFEDIDELVFVGSQQLWDTDTNLSSAGFQVGDRLIDAIGGVYELDMGVSPTDESLTLEQVLELVQQHASVCGQCCVSKMDVPSIYEAIKLVEHIE